MEAELDMEAFMKSPDIKDDDLEAELINLVSGGQKKAAKKAPAKNAPKNDAKNTPKMAAKNPPAEGEKREVTPEEYEQMLKEQADLLGKADELLNDDINPDNLDDIDIGDDDLAKLMAANGEDLEGLDELGEIPEDIPDDAEPTPAPAAKPAQAPVKKQEIKIPDDEIPQPAQKPAPAAIKKQEIKIPDDEIPQPAQKPAPPAIKKQEIPMEDDVADVPEPAKAQKPKAAHKRQVITNDSMVNSYEDYFNMFASTVFNYLNFCNDSSACETYIDRIEEALPTILEGANDFKRVKAVKRTEPKVPPPFSQWSNISKVPIKITPVVHKAQEFNAILDKEHNEMMSTASDLKSKGLIKEAVKVARAGKNIKDSKHNMTNPPVLTTDIVTWKELKQNPNMSNDEIIIIINDIKNQPRSFKLSVAVPGPKQATFIPKEQFHTPVSITGFKIISGRNRKGPNLNCEMTMFDDRNKEIGKSVFTLNAFYTDCTTQFKLNLGGPEVSFDLMIAKPFKPDSYTIKSKEYHVSPLVLGKTVPDANVEHVPQAAPKPAAAPAKPKAAPAPAPASPKPAAKPAPKPAAKPAAAPAAPKAVPKGKPAPPKITIPEIRIYTDEELNQFWPLPILEFLQKQSTTIASLSKSNKIEVQPGVVEQGQKVTQLLAKLTDDVQNGIITQDQYMNNLKAAIQREKNALKTIDEKWKKEEAGIINIMMQHLKEISP